MSLRIQELYDAGQVKRKHAIPTTRVYTIAEHVYGSLIIADELLRLNHQNAAAKQLSLNTALVYRELLYHDAPELETGDVPAPVKRASPELEKVYEELEKRFKSRIEVTTEELNEVEQGIVKASDTLDLAYTCLRERFMGNKHPRLERVFRKALEYAKEHVGINGCAEIGADLERMWQNG